jgi:hypothetical protein
VDFKRALENVFLRDIDRWEKDKFSENLMVKQRKKIKRLLRRMPVFE